MIDGMGGTLDKVRLNGRGLTANLSHSIVGDPQITRTMEGASELTLTVSDPAGTLTKNRIVREASRINIDGLKFALVKTARQGSDLNLTFEDDLIYRLRLKKGPKKAYRDQTTRAMFVRSLVREVSPDVRFICPELKKPQPIADGKRPGRKTERTRQAAEERRGGIPQNARGLTVKGSPANAVQKRVANEIITEALKFNPPRRALVALLAAVTVESVMGTVGMTPATITNHDSVGILQARLMYISPAKAMSIAYNVRRFFKQPWTGTPLGGAIKQANTGRSIVQICESIQGCAPEYAYRYGLYVDEANKWIAAYNGGGTGSTVTTTITTTKRYAFQVGKNETYWDAIKRLAEEVGWRTFVSGDALYFIAEPTLFRSRRRIWIGKNPSGVDLTEWDCDTGKRSQSATITGRAKDWTAPPGTVVGLSDDHGPAAGRWLVASIDGSLVNEDISIELKRPAKPKPEPKSETSTKTRTRTTGGGGTVAATGGAARAVKWAKQQVGVTEGSAKYNKWMAAVGGGDPWCSYFISYIMKYVCGFKHLPVNNGAHSSSWLTWSKATRVSKSNLKPGDIIVFDWGNGADTDHVALYIGGGRRIGGNESNRVSNSPADLGRCVGAVRPNYR